MTNREHSTDIGGTGDGPTEPRFTHEAPKCRICGCTCGDGESICYAGECEGRLARAEALLEPISKRVAIIAQILKGGEISGPDLILKGLMGEGYGAREALDTAVWEIARKLERP